MIRALSDFDHSRGFWDREIESPSHTSWLEHPAFRLYTLREIDPVDAEWPVDWFKIWLRGRRFDRGLSIGSGSGPFERDLIQHNLCDRIEAFDASFGSIRVATSAAGSRLRYFVADFNRCAFRERSYDAVFFHQSLHHVENLEDLLKGVRRWLRQDGVVYLDEYIGPSRGAWSDALIAPHRAVFDRLSAEVKTTPELPLPIEEDDPSEAVRSDEILRVLQTEFEIAAFRPYGGNLLSVIFPNLKREALNDELSDALIAEDRAMVQADGRPYYGVIVARPLP
jgi:SAM-dependent methyltransferase